MEFQKPDLQGFAFVFKEWLVLLICCVFLAIQIRRLLSGMVCAQDGQLHIGDRLVSVNGVSLKGITHSMALQLLKKPMELVTFVILREGLQMQGKASSASNRFKGDSPIESSATSEFSRVHTKSEGDTSIQTSVPSEFSSVPSESIQNAPNFEESSIHTGKPKPIQMNNVEESSVHTGKPKPIQMNSVKESSVHTGKPKPIQLNSTDKMHKPLALLESHENSESTKIDNLGEFQSSDSEDETIPEKPPDLPCSPPPPPLFDADDLLDGDLSIPSPPPSFSPLPAPLSADITSSSENDFPASSFPVVSPPPDLSPRMKEFIEQDLFDTEDHEENSTPGSIHHEISPDSTSSLNQANSADDWDFQTLRTADELNTYGNNDLLTSEQSSITEAPLVSRDISALPSPTLALQTNIAKPNDFDKRTEPSLVLPDINKTSTPPLAVGVNNDMSSEQSWNKASKHGLSEGDKALQRQQIENEELTSSKSPLHSEESSESEIEDEVKPVEGRRVENVPFVITYQKKFRSLGMKVDLSEEGKVTVTEVSSFGLVGKDGNIR